MRRGKLRQGLALALVLFMTINHAGGHLGRAPAVSLADTAATVSATNLNVRSGPGTSYSSAGKLNYGEPVRITGQRTGADGKLWYQISYMKNGIQAEGYVRSDYIKIAASYQIDGNFEQYMASQGFPESYKTGLRQLHGEHPSWVFTAQHTNLDWKEALDNESIVGRNLVEGSSVSSWKSTESGAYNWESGTWPSFDSGSWVAASREIIAYYMDPRNFLNEKYVFQFLTHRYNGSVHTIDGVNNMIQGTFLNNSANVGTGSPSVWTGDVPSTPSEGTGGSAGDVSSGPGGPGSSANPAATQGSGTGPGVSGASGTGTGAATVQPGVGPGGVAGSSSTDFSASGVSTGAPVGSGNSNVSLEPPGASISKKVTDRVRATLGPGAISGPGTSPGDPGTSSSGSSSSGSSSSGNSYSAPMASYGDIIMNAAAQSGVNPYVLTAMILQEQGRKGSRGISGTVSGYEGYYNFFNIEAYQSGSMSAIERGLWYASQSGSYGRPWNSVDKAILGGAIYYGVNYVNAGQDTFYLKKFNVQGSNLYKHQYMTNVQAAASEGAMLEEAYSSQVKSQTLEFKIPVYRNMPESACGAPSSDGSPNNRLSNLAIDGVELTPAFSRDVTSYGIALDPTVSSVNVRATALDSRAAITGTGNIRLQGGDQDILVSVKAQNGTVCQYVIRVTRQNHGSVPAGQDNVPAPDTPGGPGASGSPGAPSAEIITGGPGQGGSASGSGHTGPGGNNVTIIR